MRIRKGDNISVISGKDKGKTGKVLRVFPSLGKVVVEAVNLRKKHIRPKRQGQKGQIVEAPAPFDASNIMLVCPNCKEKTRAGFKFQEKSGFKESRLKTRICKKCQKEI